MLRFVYFETVGSSNGMRWESIEIKASLTVCTSKVGDEINKLTWYVVQISTDSSEGS